MSGAAGGDLPKVTCIITAYNVERWIGASIESALGLDWPSDRLEVIVVNDGSTDATETAIEPYRDRIVYIGKENGGVVSATNAGLEVATGEYIATLDGDDTWPADKLQVQVPILMQRPELGLLHGDMQIVDEHDNVVEPSFFRYKNESPPRGHILGRLMHGNFVNGGATVVRASLRDRFWPIPDVSPYQDWYIAARVAEIAEIDYVDAPVNNYRFHGRNQSLGATGDGLVDAVARDIPWQRWMLGNLDISNVAVEELQTAVEILISNTRGVAGNRGRRATDLLPVSSAEVAESDRLAARAGELFERGMFGSAARTWVRAVGANPFNGAARADLAACVVAAARYGASRLTAERIHLDARGFRIAAFADELAASPDLLAAYGRVFTAADDVTLVVYAPEETAADAAEQIGAVAEQAGLARDSAPDLLLHPCDRPDDLLGAGVESIYTRRDLPPTWAAVARLDDADLGDIRRLIGDAA